MSARTTNQPDEPGDDRSETIRMIRDSAAAVAPPGGDLRRIRDLRFRTPGYDPAFLAQMGGLGWIGLLLPDDDGDASFGMSEYCALLEQLGAGLVPEPLVASALSAGLLHGPLRPDLLARATAGEALLPVAWQERPDTLSAPGTPDAPRLFVPMSGSAAGFLVPVRNEGLNLHLCAADDVELTSLATQDGGHYAAVRPKRPFAECEIVARDVGPALDLALDRAALATAAYLLGVMEAAFGLTLSYLKSRIQFGRQIGSFQVLQHRAADLRIQVALTRASVESAAAILDSDPAPRDRILAVSRAKARATEASLLVTRQAIQLHGGIGYTDEADIGLFLRKAMVVANQYGSARLHRSRFMSNVPGSADE